MRDTMNIHNDNYQNNSVVIFFFQYDTTRSVGVNLPITLVQ